MKKLYLAYSLVFVILHLHSSHANPGVAFGGGLLEGLCGGKICKPSRSSPSEPWPTTTTKKPVWIVDLKYHKYRTEGVEAVTLAHSLAENCCHVDEKRCGPTPGVVEAEQLTQKETSKWETTSGRTVTRGQTFSAAIPLLKPTAGVEVRMELSEAEERTMGETSEKTKQFKLQLDHAVANPGLKVNCKQSTQRYRISVPFTMTWSDRKKTEGVYTGSFFTKSYIKCEHFRPRELNPVGRYDCKSWKKKIEGEQRRLEQPIVIAQEKYDSAPVVFKVVGAS